MVLGLVILIGGGVLCFFGRPAYERWREHEWLETAWAAYGRKDYDGATEALRKVLQLNSGNVEAWRLRATIAERFRLPTALEYRERVLELQPANVTNQLQLAQTAILQGSYTRAEQALSTVSPANQNHPAYHQLAAMLALARNDLRGAGKELTEAARLRPQTKDAQLNLAAVELQSSDEKVVAGAVQTLRELYADPEYRQEALRQLSLAAVNKRDWTRARSLTKELQADEKAALADRLLHLTALQGSGDQESTIYLTQLKVTCRTSSSSACNLATWLAAHEQADDAVAWMESLPPELQQELEVKMTRAECLVAKRDWGTLRNQLKTNDWKESDFMRHAMIARAAREEHEDLTAQTEWMTALRDAAQKPKDLTLLAHVASSWSWSREKEDVLWLIVQRHPDERWALETLHHSFIQGGNTLGLQKLYSQLLLRSPDDLSVQKNLAMVDLLLNLQTNRAHDLAKSAYERATTNASFVCTYAYSLHMQGRTTEGIAVLESLPTRELEKPEIALYYGVLQTSTAPVKAKKYLELARPALKLPEEKALLRMARKRLEGI